MKRHYLALIVALAVLGLCAAGVVNAAKILICKEPGFSGDWNDDPENCPNRIHLYDADGHVVNPGDTVTFGEQYYFGTEPGSGCELTANVGYGPWGAVYHYYDWQFFAVYCNEDGTDCVEDPKRALSNHYSQITPGGTGFTAGDSLDDLLPETPPDDQHTYKWMVGRTYSVYFYNGGPYDIHKGDIALQDVYINLSQFKYRYQVQ